MSQAQVQTQTQNEFFVQVVEVLKRYNIKVEEIEKVLNFVMFNSDPSAPLGAPRLSDVRVRTYYHRTWGSCREYKLVVVDKNGNFLPGEWEDKSSRKNANKHKYTRIADMPEEFIAYYYESPSCNESKQFSFRVVARLVKR